MLKHYIYRKGEKKLQAELNCIQIIKGMRQLKLMTEVLLSQKQKMLLKFQRRNVIDLDSSSSSSSEDERESHKLMKHKNTLV